MEGWQGVSKLFGVLAGIGALYTLFRDSTVFDAVAISGLLTGFVVGIGTAVAIVSRCWK